VELMAGCAKGTDCHGFRNHTQEMKGGPSHR
jgi:hypothetical protein